MREPVKWATPLWGDLGPCRIRLTEDSAWDDSWEILKWDRMRPVVRKRIPTGKVREELPHFPVKQVEVKL